MKINIPLYIILTTSLFIQSGFGYSQVFQGEHVVYREAELNNTFDSYQVYRIPYTEIASYVEGRSSDEIPFTLILDGHRYEWNLVENNMLHPTFQVYTLLEGRKTPFDFDKKCRTYKGYSRNSNQDARLTITDRSFFALIPDPKGDLNVQPLRNFIKHAARDLFIVYRRSNLANQEVHTCGVTKSSDQFIQEPLPALKLNDTRQPRSFTCLELEISFATDWRMAESFDNEEELLDFNVTVLNHVEHHFLPDFDLDFWIREYYMVEQFQNNPWGDDLEVDDLLSAFGDWAYPNFITEDIGHLWTSGNLHNSGDYGTVGYASVGGACDDIGVYPWALLEMYTTDISTLALLQAHEYGHLLDADHEEGSGTIMEPFISDVECTCWDPDNIEEMWEFIVDETCIETCVQCPASYNIIDRIAWGDWKYSSTDHIDSRAYIYHEADVVFQSVGHVRLLPGFFATSLDPSSGGATLIAKIDPCE